MSNEQLCPSPIFDATHDFKETHFSLLSSLPFPPPHFLVYLLIALWRRHTVALIAYLPL